MSEPSQETALAVPDVEGAIEVLKRFQRLKKELLDPADTLAISGKTYVKRSGWRKIMLAFNISVAIVDAQREKDQDGKYIVRVKARATAPAGRYSEEIAACDSSEFEKGRLLGTLHNIETKAATRAINRAVSDLVGGGEISAEEVTRGEEQGNTATPEAGPAEEVPGSNSATPAQAETKLDMPHVTITWTVAGEESPLPVDSGPVGFVKKVIAGVEKAHPQVAVACSEIEGQLCDIRVMGADKKVLDDLTAPLLWAISKVKECPKDAIEIKAEESGS
jgi:hypothetical protein